MATEYISEVQLPGDANYKKVKDSEARSLIATNQSNILYAINTGVKNIINVPDQTQTNGATVQVEDGVVHVTGTSESNVPFSILDHINLKAGTYYLSGGIGGAAQLNFLRLGVQATDKYITASFSDTPSKFTLNNDTECQLKVCAQGTNLNLTYYPMISLVSDGEYKPFALPNYDLTRELAELTASTYIQNMIPCPYFRASGYSANNVEFTYGEDGIINVNGTASANTYFSLVNAQSPINIGLLKNNSYVLSARSSNPNSAIKFRTFYINTSTAVETTIAYDTVNNDIKLLYNPPENSILGLQVYLLQNASATNEKVTVMLEKGYESHDYQPYNLSTFSFRTDTDKLLCSPTLVTSGSLDNFTDTSFCAVNSDVSGKPTGVTNCFVRTSKMSDTYIMQECFSASGAYYRIYDTNTWSAWMQLSNV